MYTLIDIFTILSLPTSRPAGSILSFLWTPFSTLYLFKNHFLNYTHPIFQTWNPRVFPSLLFPNLHPIQSIIKSRQCYLLNFVHFCLSPLPALWSKLPSFLAGATTLAPNWPPWICPGFQAILLHCSQNELLKNKSDHGIPQL